MKRWLVRHTATPVAVVILVGLGMFGYALRESAQRSNENHTALVALCALRHDLDLRISASREFLRIHPQGIDGLTAGLIRQSLQNSERTRDTLNVLDCKE